MTGGENLRRLLAPRQIAMFGGDLVAEAIRQSRTIGFTGDIWPVHPRRRTIEGIECYSDVAALPAAPDAAFVAVPREATVEIVGELAARGTGGAVCHASGFAEDGAHGAELQREIVAAAGEMAVIGPNCIGLLNYLDGAALWAEQHGGRRVDRGVALITQSGNIGQNLTMQRRSLPLAHVITIGNAAVTGVAEVIEATLADPRVTAIGLHLEGIGDVETFSHAALAALGQGVPIVVLKTGSSPLGAQRNLSHTSSLAGPDVLCDALFDRLGIARVSELSTLLETLKFLHVHGSLRDARISSASCSGGEAALVADVAHQLGVALPDLPEPTAVRLRALLGDKVGVANPLDYHAYIWGDAPAQRDCFTALLDAGFDVNLLLLDFPRDDRCATDQWDTTVDAFAAAQRRTGAPACVVGSLPEAVPEPVADRLVDEGIAPMQGMADCLRAVRSAWWIGAAQRRGDEVVPPDGPAALADGVVLDERSGKQELAAQGVDVPAGVVTAADDAPDLAASIGFPVVAKAHTTSIAHKSEVGAVHVGLGDRDAVRDAVTAMSGLADSFLIERLVPGAVAELIVGVRRDPRFGLALTVGAGGVLVELLRDTVTLLLPAGRAEIEAALQTLRIWSVVTGFRGRVPGDARAAVDAVTGIAEYARREQVVDLDVNPLLVLPSGEGAVAVDVLVRHGRAPGTDRSHD